MRQAMPCNPTSCEHVPLFELLDDDEVEVLAAQVEIKRFAPLERISRPATRGSWLRGDVGKRKWHDGRRPAGSSG